MKLSFVLFLPLIIVTVLAGCVQQPGGQAYAAPMEFVVYKYDGILGCTWPDQTCADLFWDLPYGETPTGFQVERSTDGGITWSSNNTLECAGTQSLYHYLDVLQPYDNSYNKYVYRMRFLYGSNASDYVIGTKINGKKSGIGANNCKQGMLDGTFEDWSSATDLKYWNETFGGVSRESVDKKGGKYSARLKVPAGGLGYIILGQNLELSSHIGKKVTLGGWVKASTNNVAYLRIQTQQSSMCSQSSFATVGSWQYLSTTCTIPSNATMIVLRPEVKGIGNTAVFDDLTVSVQ